MTGQPERDLRAQVKAALTTARISQAEAARQLDLSTKHMSQMLTGRATLTLDWADRILTLCGMTLAVVAAPAANQSRPTQPRIALDDLTSDALDALYDRLEAAESTEQARQLDTCREAFASATSRAARAEARVREQQAGHAGLMKATVELITSIGRARHILATEVLGWVEPGEDYSLDQIVDHVVAEDRADQSTIRRLEAENARYEEVVVGDLNEANTSLQRQAARAEATVARVRQTVDAGPVGSCCAHLIRAALNPPAT